MLRAISVVQRVKYDWVELPVTTLLSNLDWTCRTLVTVLNEETGVETQHNLSMLPNVQSLAAYSPVATIENIFSTYTGGLPPEILPKIDVANKKCLSYYTLWDYQLNATRVNTSNSSLSFNINDTPDLEITPSKFFTGTIDGLKDKLLFVINGMVVFAEYINGKVIIIHGGLDLDTAIEQNIGVIDFSNFNGFTPIKFTQQNTTVFFRDDEVTTFHVTLNDPISNDFMVVVNGKLHMCNDIYTLVDNRTIAIQVRHQDVYKEALYSEPSTLNWIDRISPDSNGYDISTFNPMRYITSVTNRLLLLSVKGVSVKHLPLVTTGFPLTFFTNHDTTDLIFSSDGTVGYYIANEMLSDNAIVISVAKPRVFDAIYDTTDVLNENIIGTGTLSSAYDTRTAKLKRVYVL
jgi:hypothetical protein